MTIIESTDRIEMAESGNRSLDEMFELLEQWPVPEGYKAEIVEGTIHMTPQRTTHWQTIRRVLYQLDDHFGREAEILSDVRIDFPGYLNGFCPDLAKIADGAQPDDDGRFAPGDIELIVEVVSRGTARNDYGPKKATYATSGIPVYVIVDPYNGECHAYGRPESDRFNLELTVKYGESLDLRPFGLDLTLSTEDLPRD